MKVELYALAAIDIFENIKVGEINVALASTVEGNSSFYEFEAVGHIEYKIVCNKGHGFCKKRVISIDDLTRGTQVISLSWKETSLYESTKISIDC